MSISLPAARLASLAFFTALALALAVFPLEGSWLAAILLAYGALLAWRPSLWLFLLPALLPALDLAPHTGWFFLEEIDLVLLITAGFCYWRLRPITSEQPDWPPSFRYGVMLLALACVIGLWRGLMPLPPIDANAFNHYLSPYNALRVGKAWLWTLILLPPLRQAAGPRLHRLKTHLIPGMLAGLLLVACAATRERWQFPGLLNFSSDYRITAPFSAMHTGGAALDGYLAMSFPLLAIVLFDRTGGRNPAKLALAAGLILPLTLYVGLATFSRGLYLGYGAAIATLLCFALLKIFDKARRAVSLRRSGVVACAGLLATIAATMVLDRIFSTSGYRGLAAALGVLAAALLLAAQPLRPLVLGGGMVVGTTLAAAMAWLLPVENLPYSILKAPYLLFVCSALAFAATMATVSPAAQRPQSALLPLAAMSYAALVLSAGWITLHAARSPSAFPSGWLLLLALPPIGFNLAAGRPLWRPDRQRLMAAFAALLLLGSIVPIYNGYYVEQRFSTLGSDLSHRWRHWSQTIAMMDDGVATGLLGMGLGKFPATYYWRNTQHEVPPDYRFLDRDGNRSMRISSGTHAAGYGEMLRLWQTAEVEPGREYELGVDVLHRADQAFLHLRLCARQLLYPADCVAAPLHQLPTSSEWQRQTFRLHSGRLGGGGIPVRLEFSAQGQGVAFDVDNISLRAVADGVELLRNGDFSHANNYWFFSSDRHHLPWHVKNLGLNLYFEMGWLGVLAYALLLGSAGAALIRRARHEQDGMTAAALLAALMGFQMVGLFDSLFDVPRVTLLFMLLLGAASLRPAPGRITHAIPSTLIVKVTATRITHQVWPLISRPVIPGSSHIGKK